MTKAGQQSTVKKGLDKLYKKFDRSFISPDPLECVPLKGKFEDIELSAFIASVFAYGRADLIVRTVRQILGELGPRPHDSLMSGNCKKLFKGFKYRFHKRPDLLWFLSRLEKIYKKYGTLEAAFTSIDANLKERMENFSKLFASEKQSSNRKFLVPSPKGSACKRMNLFLRWMVRKDSVDLGLWKKVKPRDLVIPMDVHVHRIAHRIALVQNGAAATYALAQELTDNLRRFDADDPVRFDFAICSLGKLGHCQKTPVGANCNSCMLEKVCSKK